ncbi:MAG: hypothetical protein QW212_00100 [Nitrososphaerales archaeon]
MPKLEGTQAIVLVPEDNPIYCQKKEVLSTIWQKHSAQVYEVKQITPDIIKSVAKGEKFILISADRRLINAVADNLPKARFLIPHSFSNAKLAESLEKRGFSARTVKLLTRKEGALARVLKLSFDDFLKLKETVFDRIEEKVLPFVDGEKEERELIRELIERGGFTDVITAKYALATLVMKKKLRAEQKEGKVYYKQQGDVPSL